MEKNIHVDIVVTGRVQGVWFRKYTLDEANRLGLKGWVKNLESGNVALAVEGSTLAVDQMVNWLHQGSPLSKVRQVKAVKGEWLGFSSFMIIR